LRANRTIHINYNAIIIKSPAYIQLRNRPTR
jgi:hypothetical protein